ncbi:MAG: rhodanese-like domain-containing protein [Desulfobacterales bacterium]|nr:rhodanese-like domain-containing protein [Desulfobacterales bacterium]
MPDKPTVGINTIHIFAYKEQLMMKRIALTLTFTLLTAGSALAANFIESDELKKLLDQKQELIPADIQPAWPDFEKQHLPGSIETATPFPPRLQKKTRLDKVLLIISQSNAPVIVICPAASPAPKTVMIICSAKGVPAERMKILEDGIAGWEFEQFLIKGR